MSKLEKIYKKSKKILTPDLYVKSVPNRGRGVFAARAFKINECIEIAPFVELSEEECEWVDDTVLKYYRYETENGGAVALGFGSLYNHSYKPNAYYETGDGFIFLYALKDIKKNQEVLINYNGDPEDLTKVDYPLDTKTKKERVSNARK